jgi:NAD-dependent deacetylase
MQPNLLYQIDEIASILKRSKRVLFVTGAGLSAEAGLPTYRGIGGVYEQDDTEDGYPIEVAVSGGMLAAKPEVTWRYLKKVEEACRGARPARAHQIIAELEQRLEVVVLTQNVDGLHRMAGSTNVIDIHGDFRELLCTRCGQRSHVETYEALEIPPRCHCGGAIRPEVVLFGEMLPINKYTRLTQERAKGFDIVFSIGTTSVFPYIAGPILHANQNNIPTVEINPDETTVSDDVTFRLKCKAGEALEALLKALV